jgi:acyl-coenzyme A thioesterase PaaI-like protein
MGKTLGLGEVTVKDGDGNLVAYGIATMMVVPNQPILGYENLPPIQ